MTAEIALINRTAVALAADSAVTVTYWQGGSQRQRFLKGANKIFNISNRFPVGLMIYDAGSLQGVPWDVVAKAFRDERGDSPCDELEGYSRGLFDFIKTNGRLFPQEYQESQLIARIADAVLRVSRTVTQRNNEQLAPDQVRPTFESLKSAIERTNFFDEVDEEFIVAHVLPFRDRVLQEARPAAVFKEAAAQVDEQELVELGARAVFKEGWTTLQTSGLVFAGFGEAQYFPQMLQYNCFGMLLGRVLHKAMPDGKVSINHENVSDIKPFAQSEMVNTFVWGASNSALSEIESAFQAKAESLVEALKAAGKLEASVDASAEIVAQKADFSRDVVRHLWENHADPLRNVIGMLAVDELADLAETLISIESLKERVTRPTESVSGPIDVAVISKGDGFIWIKRKHYFDPKLNQRYFQRMR